VGQVARHEYQKRTGTWSQRVSFRQAVWIFIISMSRQLAECSQKGSNKPSFSFPRGAPYSPW